MSWAATPAGPAQPYSFWSCHECGDYDYHDAELGEQRREHIRSGARRHVEQSGHAVEVRHGTTEELLPLATAPRAEDALRGDGPPLTKAEQAAWDMIERSMQ